MGRIPGSKVRFWTKREIKFVFKTWKSSTLEETAKKLDRTPKQIQSMIIQIRKCGYHITYKRRVGQSRLMIEEVMKEMGLTKKKSKKQ